MEQDKEVSAMAAVNAALADLEPDAVARVLRWAADRYKVTPAAPTSSGYAAKPAGSESTPADSDASGTADQAYETFSDFYDAADPTTEAERVLVAGYWFQVVKGQPELESQALNKELTHLGHRVTHMPHTVDDLMKSKPRLMIQLKKQGSTRQARRRFKLTGEGVKKVRGMLKAEIA